MKNPEILCKWKEKPPSRLRGRDQIAGRFFRWMYKYARLWCTPGDASDASGGGCNDAGPIPANYDWVFGIALQFK